MEDEVFLLKSSKKSDSNIMEVETTSLSAVLRVIPIFFCSYHGKKLERIGDMIMREYAVLKLGMCLPTEKMLVASGRQLWIPDFGQNM